MIAHIELTDRQAEAFRKIAHDEGRTLEEVIQARLESIVEATPREDREETKHRALAAIGRFSSDASDLASEHDRYLDEAYGA